MLLEHSLGSWRGNKIYVDLFHPSCAGFQASVHPDITGTFLGIEKGECETPWMCWAAAAAGCATLQFSVWFGLSPLSSVSAHHPPICEMRHLLAFGDSSEILGGVFSLLCVSVYGVFGVYWCQMVFSVVLANCGGWEDWEGHYLSWKNACLWPSKAIAQRTLRKCTDRNFLPNVFSSL